MIRVKKKKNRKPLLSLIFAAIFALLLTAAILLNTFLVANESGSGFSVYENLEVLEGESLHQGYNTAYPFIEEGDIQYISVSDKSNSYRVLRPEEDGSMVLYYTNADGESEIYYPNILASGESMDYSTLYAVDTSDGIGIIPKLSYLCSAVGFTAFQARIELSDNAEERYRQLESFGLTASELISVSFGYTDEDGERETHTIKLGKKNISGAGRYFMVDDRDYIYCSAINYFEYALAGFVSFIKPYLVAPGMEGDESVLAAYLTQDFKEWHNTVHEDKGAVVPEGAIVIGNAQTVLPFDADESYVPDPGENGGYKYSSFIKTEFDLGAYKNNPAYIRMINALKGKAIGVYYDTKNPAASIEDAILFTLTSQTKSIDFGDSTSVKYEYKIVAIESVITDDAEVTEEGYAVGDNNLLKITYECLANGKETSKFYSHAVIDLTDERIPSDAVAKLRGEKVGTFDESIDFSIDYTVKTYECRIISVDSVITDEAEITEEGYAVGSKNNLLKITYECLLDGEKVGGSYIQAVIDLTDERLPKTVVQQLRKASVGTLDESIDFEYTQSNAVKHNVQYVVSDILEIYDKDGKAISKIEEDSQVIYRYYLVFDGVKDNEVYVGVVNFGDAEDTSEDTKNLKKALVGKSAGQNLEIEVMSYVDYSEALYDFITYRISSIEYFVTSELITSFRFLNASDRDPFYGESFYENTMEGDYSIYGVNADVCIEIVKLLTGVATNSSTSTESVGLIGTETVALGLTPSVMEEYGLYDYTIYIEIPRGIYERKDEYADDENELSNYDWRDTLGFRLYISSEQPDGTRYVASDMYDLVAKVDGESFRFIEEEFVDFWARQTLLMTDFLDIKNMKVEFNMTDVYGSYNFDILHQVIFVDQNGQSYVEAPEDIYTDVYQIAHINTSQSGDCMETEFSKQLALIGDDYVSLRTLYDNVRADGSLMMGDTDSYGSSQFKNLMFLVYGIHYTGTLSDLSEEDKAEIRAQDPLMSMSVLIESSSYYYTYEFYRVDDVRIMVRLCRTDEKGNDVTDGVTDYYISSFAFKKLAQGFVDVLNAKDIDSEVTYPEN